MSKVSTKKSKRSKPSHIYAIISITVVLFVLGLLATLLMNATQLSRQLRENVEVNLMLKDGLKEKDFKTLRKRLDNTSYISSTFFTSKADAARQFEAEYGEEFTEILGFNPLDDVISIYLKANYTNEDSLAQVETLLLAMDGVKEVNYPRNLMHLINDNVSKLSIVLLIMFLLFLFIAITLIDNTIKLSMYSSRFLIKSMQLVGATRSFVLRPFIRRGLINGFISGLLAAALLIIFLLFVNRQLNVLDIQANFLHYLYICASIVLVGLLLSYWSTKTAVVKYLKLKLDELY